MAIIGIAPHFELLSGQALRATHESARTTSEQGAAGLWTRRSGAKCVLPSAGLSNAHSITEDGRESISRLHQSGDVFGDLCHCTGERREQAVAMEDCDIVELNVDEFIAHLQSNRPAFLLFLSKLAEHYGAIRDHLDATVAGNASQQEAAVKHLTANAAEISTFLSGANPNWPKDAVIGLLTAHAAHHIQQFQQLKEGDYTHERDTWTGTKAHIYVVADTLTTGLAAQFPNKF